MLDEPGVQSLDQGPRQGLAGGVTVLSIQAVDIALDVEDRVDALDGFKRNGRDVMGGFSLSNIACDVGELWLNLGDGIDSGDAGFIGIGHFDTVVELDAFDEFGQLISAFQAQPFL